MQAIFEHTRGPLPNPGQLLSMKIPFHRNVKSSLSFPLFPLNGQRRWSEAAAAEVIDGISTDPESQMRRWSMPWEASKTDRNTVTWNQTRIMPMNTLKTSCYKMSSSERYTSHSGIPSNHYNFILKSKTYLLQMETGPWLQPVKMGC